MKPSSHDLRAVELQLGRPASGRFVVETRCPGGHPQTVRNYPLLRVERTELPMPTLFWLTCPPLRRRLARLEAAGWIAKLDEALEADEALRARHHHDHRRYIEERWRSLSDADRDRVLARGWRSPFLERGIGGVADWDHVKCLHLHYAFHLARGSAVGAWLDRETRITPCSIPGDSAE
jgi:hypothetical protein